MADAGFITQAQSDEAKARPIVTSGRPSTESDAPFFVEEVRQHLEETYGAKQLYENGLAVSRRSTSSCSRPPRRALDEGIRRIDKRRGFRKPRNVIAEGRPRSTASTTRRGRDARRRRDRAGARHGVDRRRARGARRLADKALSRAPSITWTNKTERVVPEARRSGQLRRQRPSTPRRARSPARSNRSRRSKAR